MLFVPFIMLFVPF